MKILDKDKQIIINEYINGKSSNDLSKLFPYKRTTIKEFIRRNGILRSQSDASKLACILGKKDKIISILTNLAKNKNRFHPLKSHIGENHPLWIKDRSKLKNKRCFKEEKDFFKDVIKERNYTCELTHKQLTLSVHHIKPVWKNPELRFDKSNVIVIDKIIHKLFHKLYGFKSDENDWIKFIEREDYYSLHF